MGPFCAYETHVISCHETIILSCHVMRLWNVMCIAAYYAFMGEVAWCLVVPSHFPTPVSLCSAILGSKHGGLNRTSIVLLASNPGSHPAFRTASDEKLDASLGPRLLYSPLLSWSVEWFLIYTQDIVDTHNAL